MDIADGRSGKTEPPWEAPILRSAAKPYPELAARRLAEALSRIDGEVRFGKGDRALYATDASNYRQVPIGVVVPRSVDAVVETIAICREHDAPVLARGGGTSLAGQCCNVAVVIDFSKYLHRIVALDPEKRLARVEPGCVLDHLRDAAERHHLTFGPDPSTHDHNTLGGMLGNNSCGVHSVMAGRTADNVRALEIATYDGLRLTVGETDEAALSRLVAGGGRVGEIYRRLDRLRHRYADLIRARYPKIPRRVSGYNLDNLLPENGFNVARALVGSEGTCVTILEATLDLVPSPPHRVLLVMGFKDIYTAGDWVPRVLAHGPIRLEGIDEELISFMRVKHLHQRYVKELPEGCGWLVAEFGGWSAEEAEDKARRLMADAAKQSEAPHMKLVTDPEQQHKMWVVRESGLGGTAFVPHRPDTWEGWEDAAVPPDKVGAYLRDFKALMNRYQYDSALYGHFGDGCIHCRLNFGLRNEEGIRKWRRFLEEASALVVSYGGSNSGEHGDGQSKAELLERMYGPELIEAFREFKSIWDPEGRMNPGKISDPYPITSNLRLGPDYRPPKLATHYAFPDDHGDIRHALLRCVGVGKCRRHEPDGEVMCPSYQATLEETHVTRGRARMLFEMLHGDVIEEGWQSDAVEQALDLCLACKGCKSDCPVNVDMATYKSEFRAHHYRGKIRPRAHYSMGLIHWWARLAGLAPGLANFLAGDARTAPLLKRLGGIAAERDIPAFARESFGAWFSRQPARNPAGPPVMLFPDTFNNFFTPQNAIAAARLLWHAGYRILLASRPVCCGRPLYDIGMLTTAKKLLRRMLDFLEPEIRAGVPLVGLEPACIAALRDELTMLFPQEALAQKLAEQSFLLSEFIDKERMPLPRLAGKALVQLHCHHRAVIKTEAEAAVLERLGIEATILPAGCCGMAGAFGFEADHYEVSQRIAERALLPRLRAAEPDAILLADGFSCREQIRQGIGRTPLHLAELIARGLQERQ